MSEPTLDKSKVFSEWVEVDCNECSHYWDNSCDGACKGQKMPCNSFLATRSLVLPAQIKDIQKQNKRHKTAILLLCVVELIQFLILWFR